MCGIAGIVGLKDTIKAQNTIKKMSDTMAHRGPDSDGFHIDNNVVLGHRRLSIIDLSANSNQPFSDNSTRYTIVFNGEIYNYQLIKSKINNYQFRTDGDTEVVLVAYIQWGESCLEYLNGMFAFAIWDNIEQKLFMARDRLGIKPFYYAHTDSLFIFSSELRPIIKSGLLATQISEVGLIDYLSYQSVNAPYTIIENIWQLVPGECAYFQDNKFNKKPYWKLGEKKGDFKFEDAKKVQYEVKKLLNEAVERCMVSDVPVAAFLSGGIDSSAIVALMAQNTSQPINTFSIIFDEQDYDESKYSNLIAQKYNTKHVPLLLKPEQLLDMLPECLDAMDSPSGDGINTYAVSKLTHEHNIKVALTGLGGDELFAGYSTFKRYYDIRNKYSVYWSFPQNMRESVANGYKNIFNNKIDPKLYTLLKTKDPSIEEIYPYFRKVIPLYTIEKLLNKNLSGYQNLVHQRLLNNNEVLNKLSILSQFSVAEISSYTQNVLLNDSDQMSMASSLELRVPFFDHELVEYVLQVPDSMKLSKRTPKALLVNAMGELLPDEIVYRPKKGFTFPWEYWLKNQLRATCEQNLKRLSERTIFNGNEVMLLWERFMKNDKRVLWSNIWTLNVLEEWLSRNEL